MSRQHVGLVLNHSDKSVTARHYDRAGYDDEKRLALDTWAAKLAAILEGKKGADVVPITRKEARLRAQFTRMEMTLTSFQSSAQFLSQAFQSR